MSYSPRAAYYDLISRYFPNDDPENPDEMRIFIAYLRRCFRDCRAGGISYEYGGYILLFTAEYDMMYNTAHSRAALLGQCLPPKPYSSRSIHNAIRMFNEKYHVGKSPLDDLLDIHDDFSRKYYGINP